jgi:hypothetical protein
MQKAASKDYRVGNFMLHIVVLTVDVDRNMGRDGYEE